MAKPKRRKFIRCRQKVNLNETQLFVLKDYRLEEKEIEVITPDGETKMMRVRVKVYPMLSEMSAEVRHLIVNPPRPT